MEPVSIPANSVVYKTGALMVIAGMLPLADALFLVKVGAMQTGFAPAVVLMFVMGCYGVLAGITDFVKWRRAKTTPALLLTEDGITDATGIVTGGTVCWSEVRFVTKVKTQGQRSLAVHLFDNRAYLERLPAWKRLLLAHNIDAFGTPFLISESELAITLNQAKGAIEHAWPVTVTASVADDSAPPTATHWWTAIPPEERNVAPLRNGR